MNNIKMAKGLEIKTNTERVTIANNIVSGSTEKCEQLLDIPDKAETLVNGITYSINNDKIKLNGTSGLSYETNIWIKLNTPIKAGSYAINPFFEGNSGMGIFLAKNEGDYTNRFSISSSKTITVNYDINYLMLYTGKNVTVANTISPMVVEGTTVPTTFQPYFKGLHYGYYKGLLLDKFSYIDKTNRIKQIGGRTIVLNGNEIWGISGGTNQGKFFVLYLNDKSPLNTDVVIATNEWNGVSNYDFVFGTILSDSNRLIFGNLENGVKKFNDTENFKAYIQDLYSSGNPLKVNYKLLTPSESGIEEF